MKNFLILAAFILIATSCGPGSTGGRAPAQPVPVVPVILEPEEPIDTSTIKAQFINTKASDVFPTLDFTKLELEQTQPSSNLLVCEGKLGNSGEVNGVGENQVRVTGTAREGTIQFGHLAYVDSGKKGCRAASKESYTYEVEEGTLRLCNVNCLNGVYKGCADQPCEIFTTL